MSKYIIDIPTVTKCSTCPFAEVIYGEDEDGYSTEDGCACYILNTNVTDHVNKNTKHPSCPLHEEKSL